MTPTRPARRAFSLVELLVAVAVLIVIIAATSRIFGTVSEVTAMGQGVEDVLQEAAALERIMRTDVENLSPEGVFLIRCVAVRNDINAPNGPLLNPTLDATEYLRCDQLLMFSQQLDGSSTARIGTLGNHRGQSTIQRVYWGHAFQLRDAGRRFEWDGGGTTGRAHDVDPGAVVYPWTFGTVPSVLTRFGPNSALGGTDGTNVFSNGGNGGTIDATQPEARRWLLARHSALLGEDNDNGVDSGTNNSNVDTNGMTVFMEVATARSIFLRHGTSNPWVGVSSPQLRDGRVEGAATQLNDVRDIILSQGSGGGNPNTWSQQRDFMSDAMLYYPRAERSPPSMHRVDQALTNSVIGTACSELIIDWTYAEDTGEAFRPAAFGPSFKGLSLDTSREQPWFGLSDSLLPASEARGVGALGESAYADADVANYRVPLTMFVNEPDDNSDNAIERYQDWGGGGKLIVYEAFFGYNRDKPFFDAATNLPDTLLGDPDIRAAYTPWPKAIRVTMRLHDRDASLEYGREVQFVITLPERVAN